MFWWELASKAFWEALDLVGGTWGAVLVWTVGAVVTAILVFVFRGREAFMEHVKANILIVIAGAVGTCLLVFCWKLAWLPHDIRQQSDRISVPAPISLRLRPLPPMFALDKTLASRRFVPPALPSADEIANALAKRLTIQPQPLSVEFHIASPKIVTVLNHGREIQDVRLRLTEYGYTAEGPWSDAPATNGRPAIIHKPPKRVAFYQLQGYFMGTPSIPANTSASLDLWAIKSLGFVEPGSPPPRSAIPRDSFGFYALRFTFRDPTTGKRYAYTRVISLSKYGWPPDDPDKTINYSSTGTLPHHVFEDIVKDILDHQKELYANSGEEEYRP